MQMHEQILNRYGLNKEDLSIAELDTLREIVAKYNVEEMKPADLKDFFQSNIKIIEKELVGYDTPKTLVEMIFRKRRRKHLEARLYNYIQILDFITYPEKARKFLETQVKRLEGVNTNRSKIV